MTFVFYFAKTTQNPSFRKVFDAAPRDPPQFHEHSSARTDASGRIKSGIAAGGFCSKPFFTPILHTARVAPLTNIKGWVIISLKWNKKEESKRSTFKQPMAVS